MNTLLEITKQLIGFDTRAGNQKEMNQAYEYVCSLLDPNIFDTEYIEKNGVVSLAIFFKGRDWTKEHFLLNGHMDIIAAEEKQFNPYIEEGKLFGRGSADMKGGIAAMLLALIEIGKTDLRPSVALLITGDEEVGGEYGAQYICSNYDLQHDFVLVADGPNIKELSITNKEKGYLWLTLIAEGKAAHASRPWLGQNAIDILYKAIEQMRTALNMLNEEGWKHTMSLTKISTENTITNKIPAQASAVIDIRYTESLGIHQDDAIAKIKAVLPKEVTLEPICMGAPVYTPEDNVHIQALKKIATNFAGEKVPVVYSDAAHDAGFFAERGLKTALIGPVGANWHGKNEWVDIETLVLTYQIIKNYINTF